MFGLPLWALLALLNLLAVVWLATGFLDELQVTDRQHRLGTLLVRVLCVIVASSIGVLFVVAVAIGTALFRRSVVAERAAARYAATARARARAESRA